ncbi:(2fe-2s)-binding protein, partial [Cystoisospora suis]
MAEPFFTFNDFPPYGEPFGPQLPPFQAKKGDAAAGIPGISHIETDLRKFWYPVCLSTSLPPPDARGRYDPPGHRPASIRLLGTPLVLYRTKLPPRRYRRPSDEAGPPLSHISVCPETHKGGASRYGPAVKWRPVCLADKCPHKNTKLSVGKVVDGTLECLYHGWKFDGCSGKVSSIPTSYHRIKANQAAGGLSEDTVSAGADGVCPATATAHKKRQSLIPSGSCVQTFPCVDKQGFVWVWLGKPEEADDRDIPEFPIREAYERGEVYGRFLELHLPFENTLLLENLVDIAHFPFAHHGWLGRRTDTNAYYATLEKVPNGMKSVIYHEMESCPTGVFEIVFVAPHTNIFNVVNRDKRRRTVTIMHSIPT